MNEKPLPYGHGSKCTRKEREARLAVIETMRFKRLMSWRDIEHQLAREFGVTTRTIRRYGKTVRDRAKVRREVDPDPAVSRDNLTNFIIDRANSALALGEAAREKQDLRTALSAEREALRAAGVLADLHGLKIQRHEITGRDGAPLTVTAEDVAKQLAEAIERAAARTGDGGEKD